MFKNNDAKFYLIKYLLESKEIELQSFEKLDKILNLSVAEALDIFKKDSENEELKQALLAYIKKHNNKIKAKNNQYFFPGRSKAATESAVLQGLHKFLKAHYPKLTLRDYELSLKNDFIVVSSNFDVFDEIDNILRVRKNK